MRTLFRTLNSQSAYYPNDAQWQSGIAGSSRLALALHDLYSGLLNVHVWSMLGWQEIRQRYRRSTLGPLWLTISTGVLIGAMGPLYGRLFGQDMSSYFVFLAVGFIVWQFLASIINESSQVFIVAESYIKQTRMPLSLHVLRMLWRNTIIFAHNFLIIIVVLILFGPGWKWSIPLFAVGLLIILLNGMWIGISVGLICARFRDMPQLVTSIVQLAFFLSPILWKPELLGRHRWAADINPLFHFIEIVRAPLLGELAGPSWLMALGVAFIGFAVTIPLFARYRTRIAYWV